MKTSLTRTLLGSTFAALIATSFLSPAAQAQAQVDQALIDAARKEGKGSFYAVTDPTIIQGFTAKFKEKYGIELEITRLISGALGQRLTTEFDSGNPVADLVFDTDKLLQESLAAKGMFAELGNIPGLDAYPASTKNAYSIVVSHIPYSLVWNKNLIKDPPKGWQDLSDPKWKGKLMFIDPKVGGSPAQWHILMRETYGDEFIRALGQNGTMAPSVVPGLQQIAAGAKGVYAPAIHQVVVGLLSKDAPIEEIFPQPTISSDTSMLIMKKAPHPNIARLLAAFTLSVEGQSILNKDGFSPIPNVPGTLPLPKLTNPDLHNAKEKIEPVLKLLGLN
jgi:iron(III) transport system substrate-binding protein